MKWYDRRWFRFTLGGLIVWYVLGDLVSCVIRQADAQAYAKDWQISLPAEQTFAVRAICPPLGRVFLIARERVLPPTVWNYLAPTGGYCINGRIGTSFTVPLGAPLQTINIRLEHDYPFARLAFKLKVDPDCANGPTTTCVLSPLGADDSAVATATGQFTYASDVDWLRLDERNITLNDFRTIAIKPCVAVGYVVHTIGDINYFVVSGGPAGCVYTVTARFRDRFD